MEDYYKRLNEYLLDFSKDQDASMFSIKLHNMYLFLSEIYEAGYEDGQKTKMVKMDLN